MNAGLRALAVVCLLAAPSLAGELDYLAALRSEARVRSALPGDVEGFATGDLEVEPLLGLRLLALPVRLELSYRPRFILRDVPGGGPLLPLQRGTGVFEVQSGSTLFRIGGDASKGTVDLGPLFSTDIVPVPGQVSPSPTSGLVSMERYVGSFWLEERASSRLTVGAYGSYEYSGSPSSIQLPLQWGPSGRLEVRWAQTRRDLLTSLLAVRHADFVTGHHQTIGEASERWTRLLARGLTLETLAGLAIVRQVVPPPTSDAQAVTVLELQPIAGLGLTQVLPLSRSKLELRGRIGLAPFADRFLGIVYERLDTSAVAMWVLQRDLTFTIAASAARSFPRANQNQAPDLLIGAETTLAWAATRWLLLGGGFRGAHVAVLAAGSTSQDQWLGNVSATLHTEGKSTW